MEIVGACEKIGDTYLLLQIVNEKMIRTPVNQTNHLIFQLVNEDIESVIDTSASISAVSREILDRAWPNWLEEATPVM